MLDQEATSWVSVSYTPVQYTGAHNCWRRTCDNLRAPGACSHGAASIPGKVPTWVPSATVALY